MALGDPKTRSAAMVAAAATGDAGYADELRTAAADAKAPDDVRVAAVEALGQLKPPRVGEFFDELIAETKGKNSLEPVRPRRPCGPCRSSDDANRRLADLIVAKDYPLGLRREALRTFARTSEGGRRVLALAREGKLPADLKTEATTVVNAHPDGKIRDEAVEDPAAAQDHVRPPPAPVRRPDPSRRARPTAVARSSSGARQGIERQLRWLPPRARARGQWVGPDLSTIGTKYGKDELLRSILNPSAAIGYNYQTAVVATERRPGRHRPAGRGRPRPARPQDGRGEAGLRSGPATSRIAQPATSR